MASVEDRWHLNRSPKPGEPTCEHGKVPTRRHGAGLRYRAHSRDPAGRQRGTKSFARKVDADRWQAENEHAKHKGAWVDPAAGRTRFGEQAERWYASTAGLRPSTRDNYRRYLDRYVLPHFAAAPLASIDALSVREWQAAVAAAGLGPVSIRTARVVLKLVLDSAVEGGKLIRNPAAGVKPPKGQRKEMHFLDAVQVELLAEAIDPRYRTLIRFAAYSGLRPSEQTALRVGRLDLLRGTARVCEAAVRVNGRLEWGATKTGEARTVKLPRFVCDELGAYLAGQPHAPEDLVFLGVAGGPLKHNTIWRQFKAAIRAAGLPAGLRFYDLRHTCASIMIREGASVKAVQQQLGHKNAVETLNTYSHLFPDELEAVAERIDRTRAAAVERAAEAWPHGGPAVTPLANRAGQRASGGG